MAFNADFFITILYECTIKLDEISDVTKAYDSKKAKTNIVVAINICVGYKSNHS